jgi:hypothetical protein
VDFVRTSRRGVLRKVKGSNIRDQS